jgi:hydrogenase maturation protease
MIGVLGIGNVLLGDDGVGPALVHLVESEYELPPQVVFEDLGTPGLELLAHVAGYEAVIFVDAVADEGAPGTVRIYDRRAITAASPALRVGPHDPALGDTILALEFAGEGPRDVVLVGVIAKSTDSGVSLSPEVRAALPAAVDAVLAELHRLGAEPKRRTESLSRQMPWWWQVA